MKYIIKRDTKEHQAVGDAWQLYDKENYYIVQADSEGWIAHTGDECPLPEDVRCEITEGDWKSEPKQAAQWSWASVSHYRPILTERVQEPEPAPAPQYDPRSVSFNLLDRLKAAHAQAQTIPDLEAELREVLGSMGYRLIKESPFIQQRHNTGK